SASGIRHSSLISNTKHNFPVARLACARAGFCRFATPEKSSHWTPRSGYSRKTGALAHKLQAADTPAQARHVDGLEQDVMAIKTVGDLASWKLSTKSCAAKAFRAAAS
ncbi:MAG: hypothetical protein LBQ32_11890, partial [Burkholderiaceae bacterium]|nr:hypothetical protein [Burkholderiaceae bacterium]